MFDLIGLMVLGLVVLLVLIIALRFQSIRIVLLLAFVLRLIAVLFHHYVAPLPDSGTDAVTFELMAWNWAQDGIGQVFQNFPGVNSYTYSWLMSVPYVIFGRNVLILQFASAIVSTLTVLYVWRLSKEMWSIEAARKAALAAAIFPMVVLYGALPLREAWVQLFFVMALVHVARWRRSNNTHNIVHGTLLLSVCSIFHAGLVISVFSFFYLAWRKSLREFLHKNIVRMSAKSFLILTLGFLAISIVLSGFLNLPKLGNVIDLFSFEHLRKISSYQAGLEANASYGSWQVPNSPVDLLYIAPLKFLYFWGAPFLWDLRSPKHIVGLLDATLYLVIFLTIWRKRLDILANPNARAVFIIIILTSIAFAVGVGNFGTGMRHRAKFVCGLIVIVSPWIPRIGISSLR